MQKKLHFIVPLALSIVASIIYLYTAPKAMLWLDSGRLLAGIVTLGIPNPPEPLYMLFGHLFSFLPSLGCRFYQPYLLLQRFF